MVWVPAHSVKFSKFDFWTYILIGILTLLHHFYPTLKLFFVKTYNWTGPRSFFLNFFKNQTSIYNTLIYLQLWFYNPNGLTKGKTNFTSLFTLSWIMPLKKFFFIHNCPFFPSPFLKIWLLVFTFIFIKLNNRQDLRLHVGQNVCRLRLTIDEK